MLATISIPERDRLVSYGPFESFLAWVDPLGKLRRCPAPAVALAWRNDVIVAVGVVARKITASLRVSSDKGE